MSFFFRNAAVLDGHNHVQAGTKNNLNFYCDNNCDNNFSCDIKTCDVKKFDSKKSKNMFLVYYQNVRGLRSKTNQFYLSCLSTQYEIIILSETWLNDSVLSAELFNSTYNVFRCDRSPCNSVKSDGGGVLIAIKNDFVVKRLSPPNRNVEDVWVAVSMKGFTFVVGGFYIPTNSMELVYENFLKTLNTFCLYIPILNVWLQVTTTYTQVLNLRSFI